LKFILLFFLFPCFAYSQNTAKPWAYWWWPASAVNEADIKINIQKYAAAGFGGMHIIPIYGVKGEEQKTIPYLSQRWVKILEYTVSEAKKLNLAIDMTLGTGWPFGGSWLKPGFEAQKYEIENQKFISLPTGQKVKRAAPGAEGLVLDHFNKNAVQNYFLPFDSLFRKQNIGIRAFYNDSYEAYGANWTPDFPEKFEKLRSYSILNHIDTFQKNPQDISDDNARVLSDYKETISDLLLTEFTQTYSFFSKKYQKLSRNEAHGSPANILDLYAAVDIPESEFFGSKPYDIPYYIQDPDYKIDRFGEPDWKVLKLASSPANVTGKPLVSSETSTWLGNHFKVMLSQVKPIIDESFIGGVNHIFYHGIPYSPPNEPFPGWLFYASTNFNPQSHFWEQLPLLNKYIENCQSLLQSSMHDNELFVYFPIHDVWQKPKVSLDLVDVHNIKKNGIFTSDYLALLDSLKHQGYQFDFISDRQIMQLEKGQKAFGVASNPNKTYKAILIPEIEVLPLETLKQLKKLKDAGLKIVFENALPKTINGWKDWEKRQVEFDELKKYFEKDIAVNVEKGLTGNNIFGEKIEKLGLNFIRKKYKQGYLYFITNSRTMFESGKITFATKLRNAVVYDPLTNTRTKVIPDQSNSINLYLPSGKSVLVFTDVLEEQNPLANFNSFQNKLEIKEKWSIKFEKGEPAIPNSQTMESLKSWTETSDSAAHYFSGIGIYKTTFTIPENLKNKTFILDLGNVRASAKVKLNGKFIGETWALPHTLSIPKGLIKTINTLEISVTNTSFNRIRYLDNQKVNWKKFYDINMVDINYQPFDASDKPPEKSGLLGPVLLRY
jgi:alpha-L-rhamnosidase